MKLLPMSQLVRITCAAARRKNCGGGGFSKFRLAWRRADFFRRRRRGRVPAGNGGGGIRRLRGLQGSYI